MDKWESLTKMAYDSYLGFGDAATPRKTYRDLFHECPTNGRIYDYTGIGYQAIACFTEADDPVPVEMHRNRAGAIERARLCWTNDVDELDQAGEGTFGRPWGPWPCTADDAWLGIPGIR